MKLLISASKKTPISALCLPKKCSSTLVRSAFLSCTSLDLDIFLRPLRIFLQTLITVILLSITGRVQAQDSLTRDNNTKVKAMVQRLDHELSLTPQQEVQLKTILSQRYENRKTSPRVPWASINEASREKLKNILNKEQYHKYLTLRKSKKEQKEKFLKNHPGYKFSEEDEELDF